MGKRMRRIFTAASLIFAGVFAIGVFELFLRLTGYDPNEFDAGGGLRIIFDDEFNYGLKPRCRKDIDDLGFRNAGVPGPKGGAKRILILGDSFMMGPNVPPDRTMPSLLAAKLGPGWEIYNMGVIGYGPDQALLRLEKEGLVLEPDAVILGIYAQNDFNDVYRNGIFSPANGGCRREEKSRLIESYGMTRPRILFLGFVRNLLRRGRLEVLSGLLLCDHPDLLTESCEAREEKIRLMRCVLRSFEELARNGGFALTVLVIPSYENVVDSSYFECRGIAIRPEDAFINERTVVKLCEEEGIDIVDLSPLFLARGDRAELYDAKDHHLSEKGNDLAADAVLGRIKATTASAGAWKSPSGRRSGAPSGREMHP